MGLGNPFRHVFSQQHRRAFTQGEMRGWQAAVKKPRLRRLWRCPTEPLYEYVWFVLKQTQYINLNIRLQLQNTSRRAPNSPELLRTRCAKLRPATALAPPWGALAFNWHSTRIALTFNSHCTRIALAFNSHLTRIQLTFNSHLPRIQLAFTSHSTRIALTMRDFKWQAVVVSLS